MTRKSTGKKARFEIFKRDGFACQYCGRTPPAIILEIDHINPVSRGGDNSSINLITACVDCNRGKAARPLDQVPASLAAQVEEQKARRAQIAAYNRFLMAARKKDDAAVLALGLYWYNLFQERDKYSFGPARIPSIRKFLSLLPSQTISDAMDTAHSRMPPYYEKDDRTFRYFCGICWKLIKNG